MISAASREHCWGGVTQNQQMYQLSILEVNGVDGNWQITTFNLLPISIWQVYGYVQVVAYISIPTQITVILLQILSDCSACHKTYFPGTSQLLISYEHDRNIVRSGNNTSVQVLLLTLLVHLKNQLKEYHVRFHQHHNSCECYDQEEQQSGQLW